MFHVELRQFPHNSHAFNLSEGELRASVLAPWKADRAFEFAGQRWRPDEARLTILDGPRLEAHEIAMGRGWANAVKRCEDVTSAVLRATAPSSGAAAGSAVGPVSGVATGSAVGRGAEADGFAGYKAEVLARSVEEPLSPRDTWRLAARWMPTRGVGERLTVAERAIRELLAEDLAILGRGTAATACEHPVPPAELATILLAWETWAEERPGVFVCASAAGIKASGTGAGTSG